VLYLARVLQLAWPVDAGNLVSYHEADIVGPSRLERQYLPLQTAALVGLGIVLVGADIV
jgi:hypothetical protein